MNNRNPPFDKMIEINTNLDSVVKVVWVVILGWFEFLQSEAFLSSGSMKVFWFRYKMLGWISQLTKCIVLNLVNSKQ